MPFFVSGTYSISLLLLFCSACLGNTLQKARGSVLSDRVAMKNNPDKFHPNPQTRTARRRWEVIWDMDFRVFLYPCTCRVFEWVIGYCAPGFSGNKITMYPPRSLPCLRHWSLFSKYWRYTNKIIIIIIIIILHCFQPISILAETNSFGLLKCFKKLKLKKKFKKVKLKKFIKMMFCLMLLLLNVTLFIGK